MPKKLDIKYVTQKIEERCKEKNCEFLGLCDKNGNSIEWNGTDETFLKLKCNLCGNIWTTTNYYNFITKPTRCPQCKLKLLSNKFMLSVEDALKQVRSIAEERNYTFNGFCDKNGENCEWYGVKTHLKLKCNKCGNEWKTTDFNHFKRGRGCNKCVIKNNTTKSKLDINFVLSNIDKLCKNNNYEFYGFCDKRGKDIDEYLNNEKTYLKLKCNKCGYSWNTTNYVHFVNGGKCPKCSKTKKLTHVEILENINKKCSECDLTFIDFCDKNGNKIQWNGAKTYLKLKCNKCGDIWTTTNYTYFVNGFKTCQNCRISYLEREIENSLVSIIPYEKQKHFEWLGKQTLDFYVPSKNIAIECQGEQHFKPIKHFGGEEKYYKMEKLDERKRKLCEENGIKLLYYSNLGIDYPYKVYENKEELLNEILK